MTAIPDPDRWRRIAPLLERALELPPGERARLLDEACGDDSDMRSEIEGLLRADANAAGFLDRPAELSADDGDTGTGDAHLAGTTIGPYTVIGEIGRGGMGVVYEALQPSPRRRVALKVILGGRHVDAEAVRMFRRETDSLARLKHPAIASIYESGRTAEGQHFFAMELAQGRTLSEYLEEHGGARSVVDVRRRLALFRKIAGAVAYAHQRGVIHRDLKPSNILVVPPAGEGADDTPGVKVLDFGLARITDADAEDATEGTAIGRIRGTLPYMSPEQVRGRRDEIDFRTDVYALGVILYRMLAGRLPYALEGIDVPEAVRIICEQPPRPLAAAAGPRTRFDRDLEIIVLRALEKEPARRYQTVAALDEDVARHLAGQTILARPPSATYQIRKMVARNRGAFAAAGLVLASIVVFAIVTAVQARRIAAERDRAAREAAAARRISDFLTELFKVSDPSEARGNAVTAREILDRGVARIGSDLADEPELRSRLMLTMGSVYSDLGLYREAGEILEEAVATRRRLLGDEHPDTLDAMQRLAFQRTETGRTAEAGELYARILDARRRLLGGEHRDTMVAMNNVITVVRAQGRFAEAETLDRSLLETRRRVLGAEHPDTLVSMVDLGMDCFRQDKFAEAEGLLRPVLEAYRRTLGDRHPTTIASVRYLANVLRAQHRNEEAETLMLEALEGCRHVLGDDHPDTLEAMNSLALVYAEQGRFSDAEPLYRRVIDERTRALGADNQATLGVMNNLAFVLAVQGKTADSETMLRRVVDAQRRTLGAGHPDTLGSLINLGMLAASSGDRAATLRWLDQAVTDGWANADFLAQVPELSHLRGDAAFEAIVARARKNPAR